MRHCSHFPYLVKPSRSGDHPGGSSGQSFGRWCQQPPFEIQVARKHIRSFASGTEAAPRGTFLLSDSMAALDKQPQSIREGKATQCTHQKIAQVFK